MIDIKSKIYKVLTKRKESVVFDLYIREYDSHNYYMGLIYNKILEKFKVLYVPIDLIRIGDKVEDYFCYQFISNDIVLYILKTFNDNEDIYKEERDRKRAITSNKYYYIEMTSHVASKDYTYNFTQFFDKEYLFLFDAIVTLFEHLPNSISELSGRLLEQFNSPFELIKYTSILPFDLFTGNYNNLFNDDVIQAKKYKLDDIEYLEKINNRYFSIINEKKYVIEEVGLNNIAVYSGNSSPIGDEIFIMIQGIRKNINRRFNKIEVSLEKNFDKKYILYSYGIDTEDKKFLVLNNLTAKEITFSLMENKCLRVVDCSDKFKKDIVYYLENKYEKAKAKELIDFIFNK